MNLPYRLRMIRWRASQVRRRFARGLRYAIGRATPDDACMIAYDCHEISGNWPLQSISAENVADYARNCWQEFDGLDDLAHQAASRVASKWPGNDDLSGAAEDWALEMVAEFAKDDGVTLVDI